MIIRDRFLWLVVASVGISMAKVNKGPYVKGLTFFISCAVVTFMSHITLGAISLAASTRLMHHIFYAALLSAISALWWSFFINRKAISSNVMQLNRFLYRYGVYQRNDTHVKFIQTLVMLVQFVNCILMLIEFNEFSMEQYFMLVTFRLEVQDICSKTTLAVYACCVSQLCLCVAYLLSFSAGVLWHRWSEVLSAYNEHLQLISNGRKRNPNVKCTDFFDILDILRELNRNFKSVTFAIMTFILQSVFITVFNKLNDINMGVSLGYYSAVVDVLSALSSLLSLVLYVACCSKIPEKINDIQRSARRVSRYSWEGSFVSCRELFFCKIIEQEHLLYVSACDMFDVSRSVILSAIGATLTYGLLITNFSMTVEEEHL